MRKNAPLPFPNARLCVLALACALLTCALLATAGCDSDSAADDADRAKLSGSWFITDLRVDGEPEFASLDNQYPNAVLFRLRVDEFENEIFRMQSLNDRGDTLLVRGGTFDVDADDSDLDIFTNRYGTVTFDYDLSGSEQDPVRVELRAKDDSDAEDLIRLLNLGGFGNVEDASITIERERVFTSSLRPSFLKRLPTTTRQP